MSRMSNLSDVFGSMFEDALSARTFGAAYPGVNVWEDGDNVYVEAELPGMTMNDIEATVMGDQVTIKGERKINYPQEGCVRRRERPQGAFSRMLTLPWEI